MNEPPSLPNERVPSWWDRNWKWLTVILVLVSAVIVTGSLVAIFGAMRSSETYQGALARVQKSPAVIAALGTPMNDGFFFSGTIKVGGGVGRADLALSISGPKGDATVYVVATKSAGVWHYDQLIVETEQPPARIDLSDGKQEPNPSPPPTR
jgi:hypothetical protein